MGWTVISVWRSNNQHLFSEKGNCSVVFLLRRGVQQTAGSVQLSQVWCDWHPLQRRLVAACRNVIIICRSELGSFNCLNTLLLVFSIIQSRILSPQIELYRLMAAVLSPFNRSVASLNMREACIILTFWVSGKLHSIIPIVESIIMFTTIKFKVIFVFRICLSNCTLISALNLKRKKKEGGGGWKGERETCALEHCEMPARRPAVSLRLWWWRRGRWGWWWLETSAVESRPSYPGLGFDQILPKLEIGLVGLKDWNWAWTIQSKS